MRPGNKQTPLASPQLPDFTLAILLQHVGKLLGDRIRQRLGEIGLTSSSGQVLHVLAPMEGVSQQDLAHRMRIAAPTMSGILKRMEAAGLLERRDDPDDERAIRLYMTDHGRIMWRKAEGVFAQVEVELVGNLHVDQLREVHLLLRELRDNLGGRAPWDEAPVEAVIAINQKEER